MRAIRLPAWAVPVALVPAVLSIPFVTGKVLLFRDILHFCLPQQVFAARAVASGHLPFWTPSLMGGIPFFAEPGTGVFYPPNWLYHLLAPAQAETLFALVHVPIAAAGAYLLARALRLEPMFASIAALVYSTSGYVLSMHGGHYYFASAALFPLSVGAFVVLADSPSIRKLVLAALPLASMVLNGEFQGVAFASGAGLILAAFAPKARYRATFVVALAIALGALLAAVQLVPTLAYLPLTVRANGLPFEHATTWSLHPVRWVEFFLRLPFGTSYPENEYWGLAWSNGGGRNIQWAVSLYIGPLAMLGVLATPWQEKPVRIKVLLIAAAATTVLAAGSFLPVYRLWHEWIPLANSFRYPEKYALAATLCLSIAGAHGLVGIRRNRLRLGVIALASFALFVAIAGWVSSEPRALLEHAAAGIATAKAGLAATEALAQLRSSLLSTALLCLLVGLISLLANFRTRGAQVLLLVAATADSLASGFALLSFGDGSFLAETPPLVAEIRNQIQPGSAGRFLIAQSCEFRDRGGDGTQLDRGRAWGFRTGKPNYLTLFALNDALGYVAAEWPQKKASFQLAQQVDLDRAARLFGAAVVITCSANGAEPVLRRLDAPLPRVFVVPALSVTREAIGRALRSAQFDFSRLGLVEAPLLNGPTCGSRRAKVVDDKAEQVRIRTEGVGGLLVLADSYAPGWKASVDGNGVPVLRVDGLWRGVELPPGEHEVTFTYAAPGFALGAALSLGALGLCCALLLASLRTCVGLGSMVK